VTPSVKLSAASGRIRAPRSMAPRMAPWFSNILLVDDDEAFGYAAAKALRAAGYEVSLAPDHLRALRILESTQPLDLMITDIVMPNGVNGFALARMARMRRLDLRILYMTAFDVPTGEAVGKILRKPFPLEVLASEARQALLEKPWHETSTSECWNDGSPKASGARGPQTRRASRKYPGEVDHGVEIRTRSRRL
jgi:CheY-like chemotaxis protein